MNQPVQKEQVNVKVNRPVVSHEVIKQDSHRYKIRLNLFKGRSLAEREKFMLGRLIMIRTKVHVVGDLRKYISLDTTVAKDVVESMDIDLKLIEQFLYKYYSRQGIVSKLSDIVEKYSSQKVGSYLGNIILDYDQFTQFVAFLGVGAYEPIKNESVFG